jgi:hypothetical protein
LAINRIHLRSHKSSAALGSGQVFGAVLRNKEEQMARPAGRPIGTREATVAELRDEFLDRCRAKNLSVRTEWYEDRTAASPIGASSAASFGDALVAQANAIGFAVVRGQKRSENGFCDFLKKEIGIRPMWLQHGP